ncbi:hypothetical protein KP803_11340 [Vibrio sp. ZSDE26]|uniref:Uncharacterized protein n=1 Tax=Vibrio amylolyticus TaxID=2847292 RepID=A0A9X1XII2_9VIBR|nr:hypothetical protein [Vibrio amylolyticus]MCK6263862.1 hypothetical protein [Vibrio amylolyticus]
MFKIEINLYNEDLSWVAEIHQLNSDILLRHILPKLQNLSSPINFQFDEVSQIGHVMKVSGAKLGHFTVL